MTVRTPQRAPQAGGNLLVSAINHLRLSWNLFLDPRVSGLPKVFLVVALFIWFVSPLGIWDDALPIIGEVDDIGAILILTWVFIQFCPKAVVDEIRNRIAGGGGGATPTGTTGRGNENVVEGTYREL